LPLLSRPLPLLNQYFDVTAGLTMTSNTSATGLRMSMPVFAMGAFVNS
jgi:hypothetical protein